MSNEKLTKLVAFFISGYFAFMVNSAILPSRYSGAAAVVSAPPVSPGVIALPAMGERIDVGLDPKGVKTVLPESDGQYSAVIAVDAVKQVRGGVEFYGSPTEIVTVAAAWDMAAADVEFGQFLYLVKRVRIVSELGGIGQSSFGALGPRVAGFAQLGNTDLITVAPPDLNDPDFYVMLAKNHCS